MIFPALYIIIYTVFVYLAEHKKPADISQSGPDSEAREGRGRGGGGGGREDAG